MMIITEKVRKVWESKKTEIINSYVQDYYKISHFFTPPIQVGQINEIVVHQKIRTYDEAVVGDFFSKVSARYSS